MLTVFQGQRVLKDVNQCLAPCQAAFAIEQEIPKAHVACFSQRSCLTDSRKSAIHVIRLKLLSCDPSKHFCGTMASIFSLLVRKMLLIVVVTNPFFVRCEQVFPGFRRLKIPISHASLDVKTCFNIVLPCLPQLYFFLPNAERVVDSHCFVREKDAAVVTYERFRASMFANGSIEDRKILISVLAASDR